MSDKNFWGWGLPTSQLRLAMAIPSPADCRSPPSMTRRERARPWHWCFARLPSRSACFSLRSLLTNLPKAVLAGIVFAAVYKLVDVRALLRMWRVSRIDFYAAAIALVSVLLLGILQGVLLAALASIFLLLGRASQPNIAFLGRLPGSGRYSDSARHEGVEPLVGIIAFRPEASLLYINAETILEAVLKALRKSSDVRMVACDLSASPYIDLAGARMLLDLHDELASRHVAFCIVGAHAQLRELLRAEGLAEKTDSSEWLRTLDSVLGEDNASGTIRSPPATAAWSVKLLGLTESSERRTMSLTPDCIAKRSICRSLASSYRETSDLDLDQRRRRGRGQTIPRRHHLCRVRPFCSPCLGISPSS